MSLAFAPLLPAWVPVLVAALALGAAAIAYRRPSWPAGLRVIALLGLAVLLANPVRVRPSAAGAPPRLALVLDASGSMARADEGGATRLAAARAALDTLAAAAGSRWRIERLTLRDGLSPGFADAAAGNTTFDDLARLAEGEPPAAIILASDGGNRGVVAPDAALAAARVPVWCIGVGSADAADNAAVRLDAASPTAFPGQEVEVTAVITAAGACRGRQTEFILRDDAGVEVDRRTLTLAAETRLAFPLPVGDAAGARRWHATLAVVPGEATADDNAAASAVQVVDRALRLVVIEGQPYWDTVFAVRAWRRDRQLAVAAVYRLGGRTYRAGAGAEEPSADSLAAADVIVVGCKADEAIPLPLQQAIVDAVAAGKGLLLLGVGARPDGPLAALDPLLRGHGRRTEVVPLLATAGRRLALLPPSDRALPAVAAGLIEGLRPRSEVLLGDEALPLAVIRRHGAGRVAAVNAEGMWRWAMTAAPGSDSELAARFWRQLAKALVPDAGAALGADRPRYRVGQEAVISAPAAATALTVTDPAGATINVALSDGQGRLLLTAAGAWQVALDAHRLVVIAEADVREVADSARRDDALARLAGSTGGELIAASAAADLAARLARRADLQIDAPRPEPLVPGGWWLPPLVALLAAEWWLRRRRHGVV